MGTKLLKSDLHPKTMESAEEMIEASSEEMSASGSSEWRPDRPTALRAVNVGYTLDNNNLNDSTSQKNEVQNFEEEVVILKSKVKDLEQQLEDTTIETETLEKTQKSKLEQQDKTFKHLVLKMAEVIKKYDKDTAILTEMLTKKEQECEARKAMLNEEKKKWEKLESWSNEWMRNHISKTGQKLKELGEELRSMKDDMKKYQSLALETKKEAQELQIRLLKQRCKVTLHAMHCKMRHLKDMDILKKCDVTGAIKKWNKYFSDLNDHDIQMHVYCSTLKENLSSITPADLTLNWPILPEPPTCPLDVFEEMSQKALDEREDMEGKLLTQDKAMAEFNYDEQRAVPAVEEQFFKLKKTVENRPEEITHPMINKQQAQDSSKISMKLNEVAKKVAPSNLKEKEKMEKESEQLVGPNTQGLKQNMCSNVYTSFSSANANPVIPMPYFQHYGLRPLMHTSPYPYNVRPTIRSPVALAVPVVHGQQQRPPFTSLGSPFRFGVPPASKGRGRVKASTQQQAEPSSVAAETPRISIFSAKKADKSQPQLESTTVTKKEKSPSPNSGLTPIEYARNVSAQTGPAVATSQGTADRVAARALSFSSYAAGVPKQNLPQVSRPSEPRKPLVQMPCSTSSASSRTPSKPKKVNSNRKLMDKLHEHYPSMTEEELSVILAAVRARNNNTLTGLTIPAIISKVDEFLKEKASKQGSINMDKCGNAWPGMRDSASNW